MTNDQLKAIQDTIAKSIEINVNGKIKLIDQKIDNYIKSDDEWKERAEPIILMGENLQGFGKVAVYILGVIGAIISVVVALLKLANK